VIKKISKIIFRPYKFGDVEVKGITICFIIAVPIIINYFLFTWHAPFVYGDANSWLGFLANYSGGIIGGIVAFLAAKKQMDFQRERENLQRYFAQLPSLTKLSLELSKMRQQLEAVKNIPKNLPKEMPDEVKKAIYKSRLTMEPLIKDRWSNLDLIQDPILLSELYKLSEAYERTVEVLAFNLDELELSIKKKEIEKEKLEKKLKDGKANEIEKIDYQLLCNSLRNDYITYEVLENDKKHYWSEFDRAFNKVVEVERMVGNLIKDIITKLDEQKVTRK
jgi:hypothetical protein